MFAPIAAGLYVSPVALPFVAVATLMGTYTLAYKVYNTARPAFKWMVDKTKENYLYGFIFLGTAALLVVAPFLAIRLASQWQYIAAIGTGILYAADTLIAFGAYHLSYAVINPAFTAFGIAGTVNVVMPQIKRFGHINTFDPSISRQVEDFLGFIGTSDATAALRNYKKPTNYYEAAWVRIAKGLPFEKVEAVITHNPMVKYTGHFAFAAISVVPFFVNFVTGSAFVMPMPICVIGCIIQANFLLKNISEYYYNVQNAKSLLKACREFEIAGDKPHQVLHNIAANDDMKTWLVNQYADVQTQQAGNVSVACKVKCQYMMENKFIKALLEKNCKEREEGVAQDGVGIQVQ